MKGFDCMTMELAVINNDVRSRSASEVDVVATATRRFEGGAGHYVQRQIARNAPK